MNCDPSEKENVIVRVAIVLGMILIAAALRVAPHPWNFTPIGAMALFSGAMLRDRRMAFGIPLAALFAGDMFIGFHKLMPVVYLSFMISVAIGGMLREQRTRIRIAVTTFLAVLQFFLVTNFAVWALPGMYPHTTAGLAACYVAGIPFFWNTLAGDSIYAMCLFGGFALAEHLVPALKQDEYHEA